MPTSCSVAAWVTDFSSRVKQLAHVSKTVGAGGASTLKSITVWMGGECKVEYFKLSATPFSFSLSSDSKEMLQLFFLETLIQFLKWLKL